MGGRPSQDPIPQPGTTFESAPAEELPTGASASVEAQLRDRVRELEAIYRHTPVALSVVDRDLRFVRINERMASFNGRSVEEHLGRRMDEVVPLAARHPAIALARQVLESGRPVLDFELNTEWRGAARLTWLVSCHPLREDGEVTGLLTVLQSVTHLKRAEEEARAAEDRAERRFDELEILYRHAPVGLGVLDRELRFLRVNERMARFQGHPLAEHAGRSVDEMVPPSARSGARALLQGVVENGEPVLDLEMFTDEPGRGRESWLVSCHPLLEGGQVARIIVVLQDTTALHRAEQLAEERVQELQTLIHNAPVALCQLDREFRYVWVNETMARLNGRDVDEHLARSAPEMLPEAAEPMRSFVRRVFETGEPLRDREASGRPPGDPTREYTWLMNLHPVPDGSGGVRAVLVVLQDVTRLKRTQHELRAATERLSRAAHVAGVGSWEWDILEDRVWWSEELYQLTGRRRADFTPSFNEVFDLVHPDDRGRVRDQIDATLKRDEPYAVEFRIVLDDGTVFPVYAAASLERTPDGRPARLLGTIQSMPRNGSARSGGESQAP